MMDIYKNFFKAYYKDHKDFFLQFYEGSLKITEETYYQIVLQPTTILYSDFEKIEQRIKLKFPTKYKKFFATAYSYDRHFRLPNLSLAVPWYENPFEELNDLLFEQEYSDQMLEQKLIPVGFYNDNFYVCLDLRKTPNNIDVPITYFDLDNAVWDKQPVLNENVYPSFENFIKYYTNCIITRTY